MHELATKYAKTPEVIVQINVPSNEYVIVYLHHIQNASKLWLLKQCVIVWMTWLVAWQVLCQTLPHTFDTLTTFPYDHRDIYLKAEVQQNTQRMCQAAMFFKA